MLAAAVAPSTRLVAGQRLQAACSNGQRTTMKSKSTYQVMVVVGDDEPQDNALKRFRREVMTAGVIPEVRRRRYFENSVDAKKRKVKEARMAAKRQTGGIRSFAQVSGQEPAPFSDMFGGEASEIDIFF
ncbi:30S ribosomal S21 [Chlorella sorokiniana]|uniref:30S ribosomal S21 n=1 Tax=Chlorella sorokiniana TaxID=3076 RepID=A0A2P6TYV8_CHLSO|nr:30S ribosomal S21 [Chlorella sorokiniana]|eukprot:PRW59257.1 30S ribosomal S21 [Chlorella sorokiniana]